MGNFKSLFMMQLKEKLDLSFLNSRRQTAFKIVFSILGFVLITAVAAIAFYLCKLLNIFSPLGQIPSSVMCVLLVVIFLFNLISCTIGLSKTLYYSKDNQVLVTLPVNPNLLFLSKILVYYINEIKKAFTLLIPIFLGFGIIQGYLSGSLFLYFILMPIILVIFSAIPVLLGALLSIPTNYIIRFLNRFPAIKVALLGILLAAIIAVVVLLISLIPTKINLIKTWATVSQWIRTFLANFVDIFSPFYFLTLSITGVSLSFSTQLFSIYDLSILVLIGVVAVLILLNAFTSRPLYLNMITKQFEFDKNTNIKEKKNIKFNSFFSTCIYETKRCLRDTSRLSVTLGTLIISTLSIILLNTLYDSIDTRTVGSYLKVSFNVLMILLFTLAHNINVSSIYSQDADALPLNKTKPEKPFMVLFPRLIYNILASTIILIITSSIFFKSATQVTANQKFPPINSGDCFFAFLFMLLLVLSHIIWSADLDFSNPQPQVYQTEGEAGTNKNEIYSIILVFALAAVGWGLTIFFLNDSNKNVFLKLMFFALILLGVRIYLFMKKTRVLYKEFAA